MKYLRATKGEEPTGSGLDKDNSKRSIRGLIPAINEYLFHAAKLTVCETWGILIIDK
jgi:hypothetical protein